MVKITCDNCGTEMPDVMPVGEEWILGYDLQLESPNAVQRSIRFLDHWDNRRIVELGAIHLCSLACREEYVQRSAAA